jgi:signal transduction histidine kinase
MVSTFAKDDAAMRAVDKQVVTNAQSIAATIEPFCGAAAKEADNRRPNRGERIRADAAFNMALGEQSAAVQSARIMRRLAALGQMTGGIVHDFRNVLSIIESSLRLVERNSEEPEKVRIFITGARAGIDRGLKLTSQLLTFAKQQELVAGAGDVNDLLRHLELFLRYGAGPGIRIVLELGSDTPKCLIDSSLFNAAVLNLVVNARDAMPDGGEIRISTEGWTVETATSGAPAPGSYVRVSVRDSGQGMSAEVVRKAFDPFFTTKGDRGTGLGLPQVRAFMRLVGGHVSISSEPGIGTTVDLLFVSIGSDGVAVLPPLATALDRDFVTGSPAPAEAPASH